MKPSWIVWFLSLGNPDFLNVYCIFSDDWHLFLLLNLRNPCIYLLQGVPWWLSHSHLDSSYKEYDYLCPQGSVNSVFPKPSYIKSQDKFLCVNLFLWDNLLKKLQQLHSLVFLLKDSSPSILEEISSILNFSHTFSHHHKTKQLSQKSSVALNTLWIWAGEMPENLWNTAVAPDPIWKAITYFCDSWQQIDYGSVSWEISAFCQGWDIQSSLN